ncbi:hypothetical protein THOM_1626, partial [Trachipleistophora hominis]
VRVPVKVHLCTLIGGLKDIDWMRLLKDINRMRLLNNIDEIDREYARYE